jgi:glutathione peroxidase-family protein
MKGIALKLTKQQYETMKSLLQDKANKGYTILAFSDGSSFQNPGPGGCGISI